MSNVIQFKRNPGTTGPNTSDLAIGEPAIAMDGPSGANSKIYIGIADTVDGTTDSVVAIGGGYYTAFVDTLVTGGVVNTINGITGDVEILDGVLSFNGVTGDVEGVNTVNGLTGNVTLVDLVGVSTFNGATGDVVHVGVDTVNGLTGNVTLTDLVGVSTFNGLSGAVEGVSNVNGITGAVTILDGVLSFNGATGSVIGVNSVAGLTGAVTLTQSNISDITATAAEINILDGGAIGLSVSLLETDAVVVNDGGVMKQIGMASFKNFIAVTTLDSLTVDNIAINGNTIGHTSDTDLITITGGLMTVAGNILCTDDLSCSGEIDFESGAVLLPTLSSLTVDNININGNTIGHTSDTDLLTITGGLMTVTGRIDAGTLNAGTLNGLSLTVDNININGNTIGHTSDTDLLTITGGIMTVAGEVSMTTLDIGGTNITATAAELNLIDGGATVGTTAVVDGAGFIHNAAGTMHVTTVQTLAAYLDDEITAMPNLTSVGTLTSLTVDNININGNSIISTNTDGNIYLDPNGNGIIAINANKVNDAQLEYYTETITVDGNITTNFDFEFDSSNVHTATVVSGTPTLGFDGQPPSGVAGTITLILTNGGASAVTWASYVEWPGGSAPALSVTGADIISFLTIDGGSTVYGFVGGINFS